MRLTRTLNNTRPECRLYLGTSTNQQIWEFTNSANEGGLWFEADTYLFFKTGGNNFFACNRGWNKVTYDVEAAMPHIRFWNPTGGHYQGNCQIYGYDGANGREMVYDTDSWHRFKVLNNFYMSVGNSEVKFHVLARFSDNSTASDDRIKTNEEYITDAMTTVNKLKPQIYDKRRTFNIAAGSNSLPPMRESGLIAQDIYYAAPELRHIVNIGSNADTDAINAFDYNAHISTDPTVDPDYSEWGPEVASVNYTGLIAYLVKALQEKDTHIKSVESRVNALEALATS